jgi:radical SAM-linked protein
MLGDKLRFRFSKAGVLRLLSHHDLMRCFERMLRRADVPFKSTAGFHPSPRLVFALSLPLGVAGRDECVEIELTRPCDSEEILARLNAQAPQGLTFTRVAVVPMKATALPRRVVYTLPFPPDRSAAVEDACARLMEQDRVWVDRFKPTVKRLNVRPYFRNLRAGSSLTYPAGSGAILTLDLWVTQTGTARADEILRLLNLADLLDSGMILSRDVLELRDEIASTDPADQPPDGPAETLPLEPAAARAADPENEITPAAAHWGATLSSPVVE